MSYSSALRRNLEPYDDLLDGPDVAHAPKNPGAAQEAAQETVQKVSGAAAGVPPAIAPKKGGSVVFRHLSKVYQSSAGTVEALSDIDLEIPAGSIFGIIGRSGAGKSSLLRTINRLERPTSGQVLADGIDLNELSETALVHLRRRIGMIFQHFNLLSAKTVFDNVALPLRVAGVRPSEVTARVTELLQLVGLQDKHKTFPSRLSGGQKQRVGIARALATGPEILLCDEATSALDPETTHSILQLLRDINQRLGITVILITHEMSVIREVADQVLVLEKGRVAELGEVWRVFGNPQHDATKALLAPLKKGLPEDLKQRLLPEPPTFGVYQRILQLSYSGEGGLEPDLLRIAQTIGGNAKLVQGGVERIQGHPQGTLLIAVDGFAELPDFAALTQGSTAIAHHIEVLGYVSDAVHSR